MRAFHHFHAIACDAGHCFLQACVAGPDADYLYGPIPRVDGNANHRCAVPFHLDIRCDVNTALFCSPPVIEVANEGGQSGEDGNQYFDHGALFVGESVGVGTIDSTDGSTPPELAEQEEPHA